MDIDSATDAIKEEHLPVEETDDSCVFKYFEIVPLATDTDVSCTTACVSGDLSPQVKQENSSVVKEEPDEVCFVISLLCCCCCCCCYGRTLFCHGVQSSQWILMMYVVLYGIRRCVSIVAKN